MTGVIWRFALFFFSCVLAVPGVIAQTPASVLIDDLTWTELRDDIAAGKTTIIVPIGGTEQNGPAMALGKHNVRAKILSERIARSLGNALVAPVIAYVPEGGADPPTQHMRFPGTITIPDATFEKTLEYAARSFRHAGFLDIVFLGDHGGYQKSERVVAARLNREWRAEGTRVHAIDEYYRITETAYVEALKKRGYTEAEIGSHAGLADTSLALALSPDLVRRDRLATNGQLTAAQGVHGDPRRATADLGQLGADLIVAGTVQAIRNATKRLR
ncbi:MAG TPA: creatininase family protein [Casimicrobiaceae bacterium]|jgi:creatinine amidohydrolase/Fe(II)-dependent formamide hydrolase-like protein